MADTKPRPESDSVEVIRTSPPKLDSKPYAEAKAIFAGASKIMESAIKITVASPLSKAR